MYQLSDGKNGTAGDGDKFVSPMQLSIAHLQCLSL